MTELIPYSLIADIVANRDRAVEEFDKAFDAIAAASEQLGVAWSFVNAACIGTDAHLFDNERADELQKFTNAIDLPDADQYRRTARRLVDTKVWLAIVEKTELQILMDKQAKDELRTQMAWIPERVEPGTSHVINEEEIRKSVPPVDVDTIEGTLKGFAEDSSTIFARGLANAFSAIDPRFKSHDTFKIGTRMILRWAFDEHGWWNYHSHHRDTLTDIERVFRILDGEKPQQSTASIIGKVDEVRGQDRPLLVHGDYFRIRIFKNGNAHLWFERDDLVEKANKVLADYYGEVIPEGEKEEHEFDFEYGRAVGHARVFGFYPTPKSLAERVVDLASIYNADVPLRVLEPSAGTGALSSLLAAEQSSERWDREAQGQVRKTWRARVDVVEIQPELADRLELSGEYGRVVCADFLNVVPNYPSNYDRVVMNPPFDGQRDIDHVSHALSFLKPGGKLIAIMSAGVQFRTNRKAAAFRKLVDAHGGRFADNPPGSFSEVGANVNTITLELTKKEI